MRRDTSNAEYFVLAVLVNALLPILPMMLELILRGHITAENSTISASMYAVCISFTTIWPVFAVINIILSIIFAAIFGFTIGSNNNGEIGAIVPVVSIAILFFSYTFEKYVYHIKYGESFNMFGVRNNE